MTRIVSPRFGISYPSPTLRDEPADGPGDLKKLVDAIEISAMYGQGTFASRPVSTGGSPGKEGRIYASTDETPNRLYYDYGTGWFDVGAIGDTTVEGRKLNWHYGTSPPGSPADGDMWTIPSSVLNGSTWIFRYRGASTNPWECVGGAPMYSEVATPQVTVSTTYVDLPGGSGGPSVTVPRAGDYLITFGWNGSNSDTTSGYISYVTPKLGGAAASDTDAELVASPGVIYNFSGSRVIKRALAQSDAVKLMYRVSGGSGTFGKRWLHVQPLAIT